MSSKNDQLKLATLARHGFQPLEELSRGIVFKEAAHSPKPPDIRIDHRSRWFWFPDPKLGFVLGFEAPSTYGKPVAKITVPSKNNATHEIAREKLGPAVTPLSVHRKADLIHLDDVNAATILFNLSGRFKQGKYFSRIGPHVVFVNPHSPLPDHTWSTESVQKYCSQSSQRQGEELEPHIFELAQRSFKSLITTSRDQHIFLHGVSGSGKTELCKKILQFFSAANAGPNANAIAAKVAHANLLLRTFACARIGQSDSASRSVQHFECTFDINGFFDGVHFRSHYLETSRIVGQARGKAGLNYNAFYCLLGGSTTSQQQYGLLQFPDKVEKRWENYQYLKPYGSSGTEKENKAFFYQTLEAMAALGFTQEEVSTIWGVVAAVLALGNIEFDFTTIASPPSPSSSEPASSSQSTPARTNSSVPASTSRQQGDQQGGGTTDSPVIDAGPPPGLLGSGTPETAAAHTDTESTKVSEPTSAPRTPPGNPRPPTPPAAVDASNADDNPDDGPPPGLLSAPPGINMGVGTGAGDDDDNNDDAGSSAAAAAAAEGSASNNATSENNNNQVAFPSVADDHDHHDDAQADGPPPGLLGRNNDTNGGATAEEGSASNAASVPSSATASPVPASNSTPPKGLRTSASSSSSPSAAAMQLEFEASRVLEMVQSVDVITVCETLGVSATELEQHLVSHPLLGKLDVHGARRQRDKLAIHLYLGLNNFILRRLNAILQPGSRKQQQPVQPAGPRRAGSLVAPRRSHLATSSAAPLKNRRLGSIHILDVPGFCFGSGQLATEQEQVQQFAGGGGGGGGGGRVARRSVTDRARGAGLEQLIVNYWNESQTAFFQRIRFDHTLAAYKEEDVKIDPNDRSLFNSFARNTAVVEALQGNPAGVLRLLLTTLGEEHQAVDLMMHEASQSVALQALTAKLYHHHHHHHGSGSCVVLPTRASTTVSPETETETVGLDDGSNSDGPDADDIASIAESSPADAGRRTPRGTAALVSFGVQHFGGGVVQYDLGDFISAAQDTLPSDSYGEIPLLHLLQASSKPLISTDFARVNEQRRQHRLGHLLAATQELYTKSDLVDSDTHTIFCLDSNAGGYKSILDARFLLQQLQLSEFADIVQFYQSAYVHQTPFVDFFYRYNCLVRSRALAGTSTGAGAGAVAPFKAGANIDAYNKIGFRNAGKNEAIRLVRALFQESPLLRSIVLGKTKLLYRHAVFCLLEKRRRKVVEKCILVIQKHIRGHAGRKVCKMRRSLHRRITQAIDSRDPFQLKRVLQAAGRANVDTMVVRRARKTVVDFEEEQTIQQQVVQLQEMDPHEHLTAFQALIESCDRLKLQGPLISAVKQKYFWACERKKSEALLYEGLFELDKKKIYRAIRLAERSQIVAIWGDFIASIRPVITSKLKEIEEEESEYQVLERPLIEHAVRGTPGQLILDGVDQKKLRAALVHMKLKNMKSKQGRFFVHKLGDSVFEMRHWLLERDSLMVGKILKRFEAFRDEGTIPSYVAHEVQLVQEDFLNAQYSKDLQLALVGGRIQLFDTEEARDWDAMTALNVGAILTESLDNAIRFAKTLPANQRLPLLKSTLQSAETIFRIRRALKAAFVGERQLAALITGSEDPRHDLEHDINTTANAWKDLQHALDSSLHVKLEPELQQEVDIARRCFTLRSILSQLTDACAPGEFLELDIGAIDAAEAESSISTDDLNEAISSAYRIAEEQDLVLSPEIEFLLANANMLLKARTFAREGRWASVNDTVDRYFEATQDDIAQSDEQADGTEPANATNGQQRLRHHTEEELLRLQEEFQYQLLDSKLTAALANHQIVGNYRELTLPSYPAAVEELNAAVQLTTAMSARVLDVPKISAQVHVAKYTRAARLLVQECMSQQQQQQQQQQLQSRGRGHGQATGDKDWDDTISGAEHCVLTSTTGAFATLQNLLREAQREGHLSSELLLLLQNVEHKYIAFQVHSALRHLGIVLNAQTQCLEIMSDRAIPHLEEVLADVTTVDYPHPDEDTISLISRASAILQLRKAVARICDNTPTDAETTLHPSCFAMDSDWVTIQTHVEGHVSALAEIASDDFDTLEKIVQNRSWCCGALSSLMDPEWDALMKPVFRARFQEGEEDTSSSVGDDGKVGQELTIQYSALSEQFALLQSAIDAASKVRELHSFPELVLHLARSLLQARQAVLDRSWKALEEALVAVRSGECANTPGYHYLFTEIELMQELLQKKMVVSTLAQALVQGAAGGPIGALDTSGVDNRQIDRALRYASSVPEKSPGLRDLLRAAMLARRLRTALCNRNWGLVKQTIVQAKTVMTTFAAVQAHGGHSDMESKESQPRNDNNSNSTSDNAWITAFQDELARAQLQIAYMEAAEDLRNEMAQGSRGIGTDDLQPLLNAIRALEQLQEGSPSEAGLVRAGREELVRRLVNERQLSEEAQQLLLQVDADKLDETVLQVFKSEDARENSAKLSVTASTIQAYGAALCQRALKFCNLNDIKAALKFCHYHREFHYPQRAELEELAAMDAPQLLQRQLLAARQNGDQRAVAKVLRSLKDLYFDQTGHSSFAILDFPKLKTPLQFMHDQVMASNKDDAAASSSTRGPMSTTQSGVGRAAAGAGAGKSTAARGRMGRGGTGMMKNWDHVQSHFMSHTCDMIGTSLTILPASVPLSAALACFRVVLAATTLPLSASRTANKPLIADVTRAINTVIRYPDLRDEIYLQVIKQLNDNPKQSLTRQSWRMLDLLLEFVPPSSDFENFLESFVRTMGADDRRLFRLYTILSRYGSGSTGGVAEGAAGASEPGGGDGQKLQYVAENQVASAFRSIFKV